MAESQTIDNNIVASSSDSVLDKSTAQFETTNPTDIDESESSRPRIVRFEEPHPSDSPAPNGDSESTLDESASSDANTQDTQPESPETDKSSSEGSGPHTAELQIKPIKCLYTVGRELGSGTYSVVKEAKHLETDKWYASKVINKKLMRGREHLVKNEIVVLKRVSRGHPNILTLVDYFETDNSLYLVTELAKGGELFERIYSRGSFYESDAAQLMNQITSGVAHLHANGIVHRDLKPENLLFKTTSASSNLLICDFGLSRIIDEENFRMLTTTVGTPGYMAPEIFTKKGHGKPVDIWALGVIAYLLLCGFTPFDRDTPHEEREAIEKGEFQFTPEKYWVHVTSDAQNFIKNCLQVDPDKRPTAQDCLNSAFLTRKYRNRSEMTPMYLEKLSVSTPSNLEGMAMNGAYSLSPEPDKRTSIFSAKWG